MVSPDGRGYLESADVEVPKSNLGAYISPKEYSKDL